MAFTDKTLNCQDCGIGFTFTADEQELFAGKGYQNEPKRCPECRNARRNRFGTGSGTGTGSSFSSYGGGSSQPRQFFTTTCASCGGEARVPFQPRNNKPVYCSACYSKVRSS